MTDSDYQSQVIVALGTGDNTKILSACEKALTQKPTDLLALRSKGIALLLMGKVDAAGTTLGKLDESHREGGIACFEWGYFHYRKGNYATAKSILQKSIARYGEVVATEGMSPPSLVSLKLLLAQTHYNLEEFAEAAKIFNDLIRTDSSKKKKDDEEVFRDSSERDEAFINLSACFVTSDPAQTVATFRESEELSHDLLFNVACAQAEMKEYDNALVSLDRAEKLCREEHEIENVNVEELWKALKPTTTEKDFLTDLCSIHVLRAFILFALGKEQEAEKLLEYVLNFKSAPVSAYAVACANWAAIRRHKDFFDTYRKLKQAQSPQVDSKLTSRQRIVIKYNTSLLLLNSGQLGQCKALAEGILRDSPRSELGHMALAALLIKSKQYAKVQDLLPHLLSTCTEAVSAQLTVCQMQLEQGNLESALNNLRKISSLQSYPAVIATLVDGYLKVGQPQVAKEVIEDALKTQADPVKLLHYAGGLYLKQEMNEEAAAIYEMILQRKPNDQEAIARLVLAFSVIDPEKAVMWSQKLPAAADEKKVKGLSEEALLREPLPRQRILDAGFKRPSQFDSSATDSLRKPKRKRFRPMRRPPVIKKEGPIDPERWIPMKERTYIKDLPAWRRKELAMRRAEEQRLKRKQANERKKQEEQAAAASKN